VVFVRTVLRALKWWLLGKPNATHVRPYGCDTRRVDFALAVWRVALAYDVGLTLSEVAPDVCGAATTPEVQRVWKDAQAPLAQLVDSGLVSSSAMLLVQVADLAGLRDTLWAHAAGLDLLAEALPSDGGDDVERFLLGARARRLFASAILPSTGLDAVEHDARSPRVRAFVSKLRGQVDDSPSGCERAERSIEAFVAASVPDPRLVLAGLDPATWTWSGTWPEPFPAEIATLRAAAEARDGVALVADPFARRIVERAVVIGTDLERVLVSLAEIATARAAFDRAAAKPVE